MTTGRKMWQCPSCPHRAPRRGNMIIHILRWHGGNREPVYLGDQGEYLLKSKKANHWPPSSTHDTPSSESFPFPFQNSYSKKPNSLFEPINSLLRDFIEASQIPAKIAAIRSSFSGNIFHHPQFNTNLSPYLIPPGYYGKPFVPPFTQSLPISIANTKSLSLEAPSAINSQENRREELAGFSAGVCKNCIEVFIETQYGVEEGGNDPIILAKNKHICLYPLKPLRADEMARRIASLAANLAWLPWVLKNAVKEWTAQDTFLVAFKIPFDRIKKEDIIDIFVSPRDKHHYNRNCNDDYHSIPNYEDMLNGWAVRVSKNGSIALSDNDLIDFLMIASNKTWGYFRIHLDGLNVNQNILDSDSEIYCMFINNRPLHPPVRQQGTLAKT